MTDNPTAGEPPKGLECSGCGRELNGPPGAVSGACSRCLTKAQPPQIALRALRRAPERYHHRKGAKTKTRVAKALRARGVKV